MKRITLIAMVCYASFLKAQTIPSAVTPKTPEVAAFNKNIETPVSLYTGVPNISIPLYTITIKGVSVPITLNYHAGGIRADQEATWVGLGWSLDYGGQVSRKVRGTPDEKSFLIGNSIDQFLNLPLRSDPSHFNDDLTARLGQLNEGKNGARDFMPDEFYYSAPGYSGKFLYSQEQSKFVLFPKEDIIASNVNSAPDQNGGTFPFYKWNLKLPDGTSLDFGADATTSQTNPTTGQAIINAWLLKSINNTYNESITYNYTNFNYHSYSFSGEKVSAYKAYASNPNAGGNFQSINTTDVINYDSRVSSITFPGGTINFITGSRTDMATNKLDEIDVRNTHGDLIKKIVFNYSYFYGNDDDILSVIAPSWVTYVPDTYRFNRLKLDNVVISGSDNTNLKYKFDYYSTPKLPSKWTFAQDHWGYYNGAANNAMYSFIPNFMPDLFQGGDRSVKPDFSYAFALKSVTYPEGGKTEFLYENNTANVTGAPAELLATYQDDNIPEHTQSIDITGPTRFSYNPTAPTYTDANGVYFVKSFSVASAGYIAGNFGWDISTNFGISALENGTPYPADNVQFDLNKIDASGNRVLIKSFNTTSQNSPYGRTGIDQEGVKLLPGNYEMKVSLRYFLQPNTSLSNQPYYVHFVIRYRELDITKRMINVGGLRIKNINFYDKDNTLKKQKKYSYINTVADPNIPTLSSGRIVSLPQYFQRMFQFVPATPSYVATVQVGISFSSNSILPLESTSGSFAGYEYIDEYDVDYVGGQDLRTNYNFSFESPYFSQYYSYLNLGSYEPNEWTRGKLLSKKYYKNSSVIRQEDYSYYSYSPHLTSQNQEDFVQEINTDLISSQALGVLSSYVAYPKDFFDVSSTSSLSIADIYNPDGYFGMLSTCVFFHYSAGNTTLQVGYDATTSPPLAICTGNVYVPYFLHYTGFDKPKSKIITSFDGATPVVQTENYFYEKTPALHQLTKTQSINSKNETLEKRVKYPTDSLSSTVYTNMNARHILNTPIVQADYKNSTFLQSANTNYKEWTDGDIFAPVRNMMLVGANPADNRLTFMAYDNKGNVLNIAKPGGINVSYQWGYNQTYPVASVVNSSINNVFFESFEEGAGNSTADDARTGHYSKTSGYSKTLTGLDNGSYTLSYWQKSAGVWALTVTPVTVAAGSYPISLSGQIDDVRFYPSAAQMTTYTYDPLVGMTSSADAKGMVTYYEYDGFQRLMNVKDKDGNIIKHLDYHYQGL